MIWTKWSHLDSNDQLVERGCPFHLPCQSSAWINHHIIRNEEASCEKKALKAVWVPGQCHHECRHNSLQGKTFCQIALSELRKIGKLFECKSQRRMTSKPSIQPKQKNRKNVSAVSANTRGARQPKTLWRHSHQHSAQGGKCRSSQLNAKIDSWWD